MKLALNAFFTMSIVAPSKGAVWGSSCCFILGFTHGNFEAERLRYFDGGQSSCGFIAIDNNHKNYGGGADPYERGAPLSKIEPAGELIELHCGKK